MSATALGALISETVLAPRVVAQRLIALGVRRAVLWQVLALTVTLNALVFGLGNLLTPPTQPLPPMMATPFMFALTLASGLVITVFAVFWVGAWLGGRGSLTDLLVLVAWLQVLRLMVQVAASVLILVAPGLALMLLAVASVLGVWIFMNFVDVAHRFGSLLKAFGVLLLALVGILMGLTVMLALIGATTMGITPDV